MKRLTSILILSIIFIMFFIIIVQNIPISCVFNDLTGIPCPACGMTRAFKHIIQLDIVNAFKANILSVPLAIFLLISIIKLIYDLILNGDNFAKSTILLFKKYWIVVICLLVLSQVYNLFRY